MNASLSKYSSASRTPNAGILYQGLRSQHRHSNSIYGFKNIRFSDDSCDDGMVVHSTLPSLPDLAVDEYRGTTVLIKSSENEPRWHAIGKSKQGG